MPIFDDDRDSRYHVCCFHVRKGSFVIGIIELFMLGILWVLYVVNTVIYLGENPDQSGNGWGNLIGGIIGTVIWVIVTPLMMYGVVKKKPLCLIPHIVAQVNIFLLFVFFFLKMAYILRFFADISNYWHFDQRHSTSCRWIDNCGPRIDWFADWIERRVSRSGSAGNFLRLCDHSLL